MYEYLFPPDFWWRMFLFLAGSFLAIFIVNTILRKLLGVKKKSFFSYNFINSFHEKADWSIRILTIVCIIFLAVFAVDKIPAYMFVLFVIAGLVQETLRAVMEKKYAENPNDYLFTIIQMPTSLIILFGVAYLSFSGLLPALLEELS